MRHFLGHAQHVDRTKSIAGPDSRAGSSVRGDLEDANGRRRRDDPAVRRGRRIAVPAVTAWADRGQVLGRRHRGVVTRCGTCGPLGAALVAHAAIGGAAQANAPRTLPDLELAEAGRTELRHEGWQEALGQTVDGRVIGGSFGGRALHAAVLRRGGHPRVPGMR